MSSQDYQQRRQRLANQLPDDSIAIIAGAKDVLRNGDAHYRFRQDSDFYYLTGFNEPNAVLLLMAGSSAQSYLFCQASNPSEEQWTGRRLGQDGAKESLGMHDAFVIDELSARLPLLLSGKSTIYYPLSRSPFIEQCIHSMLGTMKGQVRKGIQAPTILADLDPLLSEMRLFKSNEEIALIRQAVDISVAAHSRVMHECKHLHYEYEIEALLVYEMTRRGCRGVAYEPIVGSGENTCILHYTENNRPLRRGELVLIDAGGEYANYAADITRTLPISGQFSEAQRRVYDIVLRAQQAGIACIKPGVTWNSVQETMLTVLTEGLKDLGILKGQVNDLVENQAYKPFYMHNSGHWLGLDVHDAGLYKCQQAWRVFEPGMVLTVEPGLYIPANMPGVDACWWNIGIRIEDDILVTHDGHENLSGALPVEIDTIEAIMRD